MSQKLFQKITNKTACAAVIGLGYVGLPLAVEVAKSGYETIGFDLSDEKVSSINSAKNYIPDVDNKILAQLVQINKLKASKDFSLLSQCDFISVCVPTPLGKGKNPDMSFIMSAITEIKKHLREEQVIILESTTYPGTTEEVVLPILEETGLKAGENFFLAFSPERIDPGNKNFGIKNTPKVIGGISKRCTEIAQTYYHSFIDQVIPVSSPRSAEMVKILENTFRAINIGLANEVSIMCNHLGIDTWEVIEAAATKPFGFMPFYPGPGLGGHCIPVDPHYLVWKMKLMDYNARFIQLADEINSSMPHLVVEKVIEALNNHGKAVKNSKILVLGVAYKKDINDYRESPALDIIEMLQKKGGIVSYHDPYVPQINVNGLQFSSSPINSGASQFDCSLLLTNHSLFDIKKLVSESLVFVDTRNATKTLQNYQNKIIKL